ncbi:hypothetical protein CHS0354_011615 [Potamilus streckersoni]|uniref:Uncharacterized protein n=1 Tax=Potamilus streckersoni TaxID=2493646 RepID=A0AAE0WGH7_9BIVA|nr:hypothetical protein CHS0354_011615 [Potamilus streckersoni]
MEELSRMLSVKKELLESSVQENKCDDLSAMFNMLLDFKRQEKGLFDFDYTTKHDKKSDHRGPRPRKSKSQSKAKATPAILCPDMNIELASDTEGGNQEKPTTSTSFDFMALCSAPTWLGPERRRSRRRKHTLQGAPASPVIIDGHQDVLKPENDSSCQGNLLMPNQAAAHVTALLRRNSSRRTRRTSSCGPPSRRNSARSRRHGGTESQPQSPNSPISPNAQTPTITIQTPKSSPIVSRPANLQGLKECYSTALTVEQQNSCLEPQKLVHAYENGTNVQCSESLNPCFSMSLLGDETVPKSNLHHSFGQEETVESKIASADIQSIVRPKKYLNNGSKKDSHRGGNQDSSKPMSLLVPSCDYQVGVLKASPEIVIESMQRNTYMNLSDDEKLKQWRQNCELPRTDSEKRIEQGITEIKLQTVEDHSHAVDGSSTELLGTALLNVSNCGTISQELPESDASVINLRDIYKASSRIHRHFECSLSNVLEPNSPRNLLIEADKIPLSTRKVHNTIDGFSKRERISLLSASCALQSSDANSSEENLLLNRRRRRLKERVTSDESFVPDLLSPSDNICLNNFEERRDSPPRSRASSFRSSKHGSFRSSKHGSTQSVRFMMPSTPICQTFKSPIARIESFHSEDFEEFNTEMDVLVMSPSPSPSPNSVQSPTVPCFQYKIHSQRKKKNLKQSKSNKGSCVKNSAADAGATSRREEKPQRLGGKTSDCVFSSGSEGGSEVHLQDSEKSALASKAKIHPMDKDEQDSSDLSMKGSKVCQLQDKSKMISDLPSDQTSSKKFQNSLSKFSKTCQETEPKKSGMKTSIKRGFAHLLKKKKFNPDTSTRNNNNDVDSPSRNNRLATTRNGHARGPRSDSLLLQGTLSENQIIQETVSGNLEIRPSSAPRDSPSPTRTKVYDFSIGNESSKSRTCLISWKGCRDCTFSDEQSSEEGSDSNIQVDTRTENEVNTSIPMNNFQESKNNEVNTSIPMNNFQESKNYAAYNVTNL